MKLTDRIYTKYGKSFNNSAIARTPEWIENQIRLGFENARKFKDKQKYNLTQCPMCESANSEEFASIYGFKYVQCKDCENLYLKNPLVDLTQLYTNDGAESSFEVYLTDEIFEKRKALIATPKAEFIDEVAQRFCFSRGLWLDIGSGGGELLWAAKRLGYEIKGFESDLKAINFSNQKLEKDAVQEGFLDIQNCDESLLANIKKADIITFFNVIEHLQNPKGVIEFFKIHMKKDALLVIEVPSHPSLASFANMVSPTRVYRHMIPPFHLNIFSERSLLQVANARYMGGGYLAL
ncbi:class I SAM-dependent methyltransferase [Helicobacter himalayensis]|uniref:class I SAM-dependent methyltransferase n=1 Tax=Helicobacter himalayensis TaxID=1591088 RepID=UPI00082DD800|nr:class I SAM-dependent methyltransferase [Helicobacter himalayensis]